MKTKLLVATALVVSSFTPAMITPAFAITPEAQAALQQVCDDLLRPNDPNSEFQTEPTGVSEVTGPEFVSDVDTVVISPGGVLISQTSVYQPGSQHRHGGSPNIFGAFTVTSVYSGAVTETTTEYSQTTTYTFGCFVYKIVGQDREIAPPGLQTPVGLTEEETVVTRTETTTDTQGTSTVVTTGDGVICISPSTTSTKGNPGVWRQQNGYTGECSTALFYSLAGIPDPIPSNSLPPA